jgi:MFS family permease
MRARKLHLFFFALFIVLNGLTVGYGSIINEFVRNYLIKDVCKLNSRVILVDLLLEFISFVSSVLGSILGGKLIQYGRRKCVIMAASIGFITEFCMCIPNIWVFIIGRLITGFVAGVRLVATARLIEEYVPQRTFSLIITIMYFSVLFGLNVA